MALEQKLEDASDALMSIDAQTRESVLPHRKSAPVKALSWYSEIGDQPQLRSVAGALLAGGAIRSDWRMARAGARMLLAHQLATAAKNFVKKRVDRSRPRSAGEGGHEMTLGRSEAKEETSFPSGHSAGAVAAATAFAREYPEHKALAYSAAGAVALAQIPRCAHYPTDVGAGAAIGALSEVIIDRLLRRAFPASQEALERQP